MNTHVSDVAFSPAVKQLQSEHGSRAAYARSDFEREIDSDLVRFLTHIDTGFIATVNADGQPYIQHRGGPKGFIEVVDSKTLGFVDFVGNRQYITTGNLTENDRVVLFLIDYEHRRRVKVWGHARVVPATPELVQKLAPPGYRAKIEQVVLVTVTAWDVNCPQHIPQKLDAAEVSAVVEKLENRIAELERENARLGGEAKRP